MLTFLILLGCGQTPQAGDPLDNTKWILQSIEGHPPLDSTTITLEFSDGRVRGSSGCNEFFSDNTYEISKDGHLILPRFAMTMALCFPEERVDQEDAYIKALDNVTGYRLTKGQLELLDETGDTSLVYTNQNLMTLPLLIGAIVTGALTVYLLWFLWKNRVMAM